MLDLKGCRYFFLTGFGKSYVPGGKQREVSGEVPAPYSAEERPRARADRLRRAVGGASNVSLGEASIPTSTSTKLYNNTRLWPCEVEKPFTFRTSYVQLHVQH